MNTKKDGLLSEWWIKEAWPILKSWGESFADKWSSHIWPTLQFYMLIIFLIAAIYFIVRFIQRKFKVNRWLIIGLGFFTIIAIPAIIFLDSDISWGVFLASLLGFIGSVIIEKYVDEKERLDAEAEKTKGRTHAVNVLRLEMKHNFQIAKTVHSYMNDYKNLSPADLQVRKDDLFYRFSTTSKDALWYLIVDAVEQVALKEVQEIYSEFVHLNHQLDTFCEYLSRNMKVGHIHQDYRSVLETHPWSIRMFNALAQCIQRQDAVMKELSK